MSFSLIHNPHCNPIPETWDMSTQNVGGLMLLWRWLRMMWPSEKTHSTSTEVVNTLYWISDLINYMYKHTRYREIILSHSRELWVYMFMLLPLFQRIVDGYWWHSEVAGVSRSQVLVCPRKLTLEAIKVVLGSVSGKHCWGWSTLVHNSMVSIVLQQKKWNSIICYC